jgi:hypothetical protein
MLLVALQLWLSQPEGSAAAGVMHVQRCLVGQHTRHVPAEGGVLEAHVGRPQTALHMGDTQHLNRPLGPALPTQQSLAS